MTVIDHAAFLKRLSEKGVDFDVFYDIGASIGQ